MSASNSRTNASSYLGPVVVLRRVTDPQDPAIALFGRLQRRVYFEADMLIPARYIAYMIAEGGGGGSRSNFLVVAEEAGRLLGGTLFHRMAGPKTGFSSFMGVAPEARGHGVARRLHEERLRVLDGAGEEPVRGVFIDVVAPDRLSPEELERERRVGSDPVQRRQVFQRLGFRQVDVRYQQPVGGPDGGPVTNMDLLFCPRGPMETIPLEWVADTLLAYWSPWLGERRAEQEVRKLRGRSSGEALRLLPATP